MIFKYLRRKLGIDDLYDQYHGVRGGLNRVHETNEYLVAEIGKMRVLTASLVGRLEPKLAQQEDNQTNPDGSPNARRAESDAIGEAVLKRLEGERIARMKIAGDPDWDGRS